jgi:hypothetical protein
VLGVKKRFAIEVFGFLFKIRLDGNMTDGFQRSLAHLLFKARHDGDMTQSLREASTYFHLKSVMTET